MEFVYGPMLAAYMDKKGKKHIVIDVSTANTSDIEITEIFLRFAKEEHCRYLMEKKKFRKVETERGWILLPNYHIDYEPTVTLDMAKFLCFHRFVFKGMKV